MSIYAISDLHLDFDGNKPMDIFGTNWENHFEKIKQNWINNVNTNDLVILPGDFSWAMHLKDTYKDFEYINNLPGKKILLRGNHDYWWTTLTKMNIYLLENNFKDIEFLQNNSIEFENKIITGTRGWGNADDSENKKIINREILRLEMSLKDAKLKYTNEKEIIVCMHFPPFIDNRFINMMKEYNVKKCIYGHLHGDAVKDAKEGNINGIEYKLVSCDKLEFKLIKI
jgi:predicted phosphohydrolase